MPESNVHITESELEILGLLWERKRATVREVHEALGAERSTGYTSTLKQMQVMLDKGLLKRDDSQRQHVYLPAVDKKKAQRRFTDKLMRNVFGGSPAQLVLHALSQYKTSAEELDEIRRMIEDVKSKKDKS